MYEGECESKAILPYSLQEYFYWASPFPGFPVWSDSCPTILSHLAHLIKQNPHTQYWKIFCLLLNTSFAIKTTKTRKIYLVLLTRTAPRSCSANSLQKLKLPPKLTRVQLQDQDLGSPGRFGHSPTLGIFHICWTNSVFNSKWRVMQMWLECLLIVLVQLVPFVSSFALSSCILTQLAW